MDNNQNIQWPSDLDSFRYQITFDFITTLAQYMKSKKITQKMLAQKLKVTEGRVSQVFNNPGNFTLQSMVEWAHAAGIKPSVILYDDDDPNYRKAPVYAGAFVKLWEIHDKPKDFEDIQAIDKLCGDCRIRKNLCYGMKDLGTVEQLPIEKAKIIPFEVKRTERPKWETSDIENNQDDGYSSTTLNAV